MPTYLCHGFRWQRRSIQVYVVVQNLDDASPEWIIPAKSSQCFLESFYKLFDFLPDCVPPPSRGQPSSSLGGNGSDDGNSYNDETVKGGSGSQSRSRKLSHSQSQQEPPPALPLPSRHSSSGVEVDDITAQDWSVVKVLEEYDPMNLTEVSRPYAYVADHVVPVTTSVSIVDEIQRYEARMKAEAKDDMNPAMTGPTSDETPPLSKTSKKKQVGGTGWFEKLRDQLQRGEEIRWYVVVNGDEVRDWPDEPEPPKLLVPEGRDDHHPNAPASRQKPDMMATPQQKDTGMGTGAGMLPLRGKMSVDGGGGGGGGGGGKTPTNTNNQKKTGGLRALFGRKAHHQQPEEEYSPT